jgi:hypothetical protein
MVGLILYSSNTLLSEGRTLDGAAQNRRETA